MTELEPTKQVWATRSSGFICLIQLERLCETIRFLLANGLEPGSETRRLLACMRDDFAKRFNVLIFPEMKSDMTGADLLTVAEFLHATNMAFLTPEEAKEREKFGFYPKSAE